MSHTNVGVNNIFYNFSHKVNFQMNGKSWQMFSLEYYDLSAQFFIVIHKSHKKSPFPNALLG